MDLEASAHQDRMDPLTSLCGHRTIATAPTFGSERAALKLSRADGPHRGSKAERPQTSEKGIARRTSGMRRAMNRND